MEKMVQRVLAITLFVLFFNIVFVAAIDTDINVRTLSGHKVSILILNNGGNYYLYDSFHKTSDSYGVVTAKFTGDQKSVKISVKVVRGNDTIINEKFEDAFTTGSPLYLQVIPGNVSRDYRELDKPAANSQNTGNVNSTLNVSPNNAIPRNCAASI